MAKQAQKLKFSPSHSERWMNCPGALQLCATLPVPPSSKHAMEGTAAHELAANCLKMRQNAEEWVGEYIEVEDKKFKVTEEMALNVQIYLDAVRGDMEENGVPHRELSIETKFEVDLGSERITGTNDASFSSPLGMLYVYDYKHGAGMYVEVVENTQLMLYAVGAMKKAGWVNEAVEVVIVQPRFTREEVAPVRRWEVSKLSLCAFIAKAKNAIEDAKKKDAPLVPGPWCGKTFCPAFGQCPGVRKEVVAVVDEASTALRFPDPANLSPAQIAKVLEGSKLISEWAKAVRDYAESQARDFGAEIPGYKLIQKYGRRAWTDELMVENEFEHEFGDAIYDKKLKSPAQMEKVVGKDRVKDLTSVAEKGLELVPETAKGEAVTADKVFEVIKGEK
jgi:hypothetical protein